MSLRDILFTPGITRPAVVLAALACFAVVLLVARGIRAGMTRLAPFHPATPGLSPVPIHAATRRR